MHLVRQMVPDTTDVVREAAGTEARDDGGDVLGGFEEHEQHSICEDVRSWCKGRSGVDEMA